MRIMRGVMLGVIMLAVQCAVRKQGGQTGKQVVNGRLPCEIPAGTTQPRPPTYAEVVRRTPDNPKRQGAIKGDTAARPLDGPTAHNPTSTPPGPKRAPEFTAI